MRRCSRLGLAVLLVSSFGASGAVAEEGGGGRYVPGAAATLIDLPPTDPGFLMQALYLGFSGEASASAVIPDAGTLTLGLDATAHAVTLGGVYTFEQQILGAYYSLGAYVPFVHQEVTASVVGPLGNTTRRTDSVSGLGDISLIPALLAWKRGEYQVGFALPIYAPTGSFEVGRLANQGLNYWTIDPTVSIAYSGATNGFNAALFAGVTINSENPATDYQSGSTLHVEASVQQLFPVGPGLFGIGANAFLLEQITDDSGPGATLGGFRGRSIGIGPVLDYVLPVGDSTAIIEARWLPEIETRNRVAGDYFWVKAVWQF